MKHIYALFIGIFSLLPFSNNLKADCILNAPVVTISATTACSISFSWVGDPQTDHYTVSYRKVNSPWQPEIAVSNQTSWTFNNLLPGTYYAVEVIPYCPNNSHGPSGIRFATTPSCSAPESLTASQISANTATIVWSNCGDNTSSYVRYRPSGLQVWQIIPAGNKTSLLLSQLNQSTVYEYEVKTCGETGEWSATKSFKTLADDDWKPNILCIVLDDCRYDVFAPNGGPTFFQSPGINRIATEGARFEYAFPALSLCSPSRASIVTGLYPHHHEVITNGSYESFALPTVANVLHDYGYYNGFVGKYGFQSFPNVTGFDYYCESSNDFYIDTYYDYNGQMHVKIPGHKTDVITNKALEFLNSVPTGKRFLLYVDHKAPHVPYTPRPQDEGIFDNETMPFPDNFNLWTHNIPSTYLECYSTSNDSADKYNQMVNYYELLAGAEASIDTILSWLEHRGILDSTLVIFTSDNGLMIGEHELGGKEIALEESIRLPMFIRYPRWFAPGTVISDEMAMNIDIAPTMLEAAGVPDGLITDGLSMHELANHTAHRNELFYEYFYRNSCNPTSTSVRDFNYKYVTSRCTSAVEEFYDLTNDPKENINLINAPNYSSLIQQYKSKLDSLKQVYGYVLVEDTIEPCYLKTPDFCNINFPCNVENCNIFPTTKITDVSSGGGCADGKIKVIPTGTFNYNFHLELYDSESTLLRSVNQQSATSAYTFTNLTAGNYSVKVYDGDCFVTAFNDLEIKCAKPLAPATSGITGTSATISWSNQPCNSGYKVQYRVQGASTWLTVKPKTNINIYQLINLTANTNYEWKVSTKCANASPTTYSNYCALKTFNTSLRLGGTEAGAPAFSIYPNPANDMISVNLDVKETGLLQVQDALGRTIMEEKLQLSENAHKINIAMLSPGVYLVSVKTGSGISEKSFVKE
ncbi:MAG: sulfatase-like hydrolase/transferase [Chitinophagaceae bacterium]|nr:sulfatase-like hydrolase/transferase [Chitinophagaceae bacterium]